MPIYEIPALILSTHVGRGPFWQKRKWMEVDGFGLLVNYNDENDLTPEKIRLCLRGQGQTEYLIEAESRADARKKFNEMEGAKIGTRSKALRIDPDRGIRKIPDCKRRHINKNGDYVCGKEMGSGSGEFGMCAIEGYDMPEFDCPLRKEQEREYKEERRCLRCPKRKSVKSCI